MAFCAKTLPLRSIRLKYALRSLSFLRSDAMASCIIFISSSLSFFNFSNSNFLCNSLSFKVFANSSFSNFFFCFSFISAFFISSFVWRINSRSYNLSFNWFILLFIADSFICLSRNSFSFIALCFINFCFSFSNSSRWA